MKDEATKITKKEAKNDEDSNKQVSQNTSISDLPFGEICKKLKQEEKNKHELNRCYKHIKAKRKKNNDGRFC